MEGMQFTFVIVLQPTVSLISISLQLMTVTRPLQLILATAKPMEEWGRISYSVSSELLINS